MRIRRKGQTHLVELPYRDLYHHVFVGLQITSLWKAIESCHTYPAVNYNSSNRRNEKPVSETQLVPTISAIWAQKLHKFPLLDEIHTDKTKHEPTCPHLHLRPVHSHHDGGAEFVRRSFRTGSQLRINFGIVVGRTSASKVEDKSGAHYACSSHSIRQLFAR